MNDRYFFWFIIIAMLGVFGTSNFLVYKIAETEKIRLERKYQK